MVRSEIRLVWADCIRIIAIYLVILIHLASILVIPWDIAFTSAWWSAHLLSSVAVICVPFLVLLSGALLLYKVESPQIFYKKRAVKIISPWFFWMSIVLFLDYFIFNKFATESRNIISIGAQYLRTAYWFMPVLFQLYLITPLLRVVIQKISSKQILYLGAALQMLISLQYTYCAVSQGCEVWNLPLGLQYLGYFILGYGVLQVFVPKAVVKLLVALCILGTVSTVYITYLLSIAQQGFNAAIYHFISVPVFLASVSAFIVLRHYFQSLSHLAEKTTVRVHAIAKESFSIFFVHGVILNILLFIFAQNIFSVLSVATLVMIPLCAGLLFSVSYGIVVLLRKLPIIRLIA